MMEYILQTLSLLAVFFVYILSGSVVYSFVGEGYKATPLRCFAVGSGLWVVLVFLSTVFLPVNIGLLWYLFIAITVIFLLILPKKDQKQTLDKSFFYQILVSLFVLSPIFLFLKEDGLHLWQEFAIYGKSFLSLVNADVITDEMLSFPLAYQVSILPVSYFVPEINNSVFACFNLIILSLVACEFVRNSGVKPNSGNMLTSLVACFLLLLLLNPFSINYLLFSADPFIFICAIGFAFAEYIFRAGHLPKNIAVIPPALTLALLVMSSIQGFLLGVTLFIVLSFKYLSQIHKLNYKQLLGYFIIPLFSLFILVLWKYFLSTKGLSFLFFDFDKLKPSNILTIYHSMSILVKSHLVEFIYLVVVMLLGLFAFLKTNNIKDKYLLKSVFGVCLIYLFVCLPLFFSQYIYVAKASYSLGLVSISLIQFIVLMPIGRFLKEGFDYLGIKLNLPLKITLIVACFIIVVMNKDLFAEKQNIKVTSVLDAASSINNKIGLEKTDIAVVDLKKVAKFYSYVLNYGSKDNINYTPVSVKLLPESIKETHNFLKKQGFSYVFLHAPNNLLEKKLEHNLDPAYIYLYKITDEGFLLIAKFENKLYKDTNIMIK